MTADVEGVGRHTSLFDTSKSPLHIPLCEVRQLPRERRAVGAVKTAVGREKAPHTSERPINRAFYRRG